MSSPGKFIRARLAATSAVTDLIGTRIHPIVLPQNATYPAVVYSITAERIDYTKGYAGNMDRVTVQFNIWGDDYDELESIHDAIEAALDYNEGTAGGETMDSIRITSWHDGIDQDGEYLLRQVNYTMVHNKS